MPGGPRQLGLFGPSPEEAAAEAQEQAASTERRALTQLAASLPSTLRFGTSSWTFRGWQGLVYRERYANEKRFVRDSLAEYARYPLFRTVGVDRSYYAPVPQEELARWGAQLPSDFQFVMKVWSEITAHSFPSHARYAERAGQKNASFFDPDAFAHHVADPVRRALGRKVGAFVLEIPPSERLPERSEFERKLSAFFERAPRDVPLSVELRDRRLLSARYFDLLRAHGVAHVFNYWSRMPSVGEQLALAAGLHGPVVVCRLLLPPGARYADLRERWAPFDRIVEPAPQMRADVLRLVRAAAEQATPTFVIVNNKAEGCSPLTIRALATLLAGG